MTRKKKNIDLFMSVTVLPTWRQPARTAAEVQERASLTGEFMEIGKQLAAVLKDHVLHGRSRQGEQAGGR